MKKKGRRMGTNTKRHVIRLRIVSVHVREYVKKPNLTVVNATWKESVGLFTLFSGCFHRLIWKCFDQYNVSPRATLSREVVFSGGSFFVFFSLRTCVSCEVYVGGSRRCYSYFFLVDYHLF